MEIKNEHVGPMTNVEVLNVLKQQMKWHKEKQRSRKGPSVNSNFFPTVWINKETTTYLMDTAAAKQTRDDITALVQGITDIDTENKLTRLHKLQIINLRPTSAPSLIAIIPQCSQWFTAEKIKKLLECIQKHLPEQDDDDDDDDEEEDEDDDDLDDNEYDDQSE